jgi:hypothetical protein
LYSPTRSLDLAQAVAPFDLLRIGAQVEPAVIDRAREQAPQFDRQGPEPGERRAMGGIDDR